MGPICISISTLLYFSIGISCLYQRDYSHGLMWFGYVIANLGLLWYELQKMG